MEIPAFFPSLPAIELIRSNSCSDSTLNMRILVFRANSISSSLFPTPEYTTLDGSTPALIALNSSPPDTMSTPPPMLMKVFRTARFEFAFTEKQMVCGIPAKASSIALKWRSRVALE